MKEFALEQKVFLSVSRVYPATIKRQPTEVSGERHPNGGVYSDYAVEFIDENRYIGMITERYFASFIFATEEAAYIDRLRMSIVGIEMEIEEMNENMTHVGKRALPKDRLNELAVVMKKTVRLLGKVLKKRKIQGIQIA